MSRISIKIAGVVFVMTIAAGLLLFNDVSFLRLAAIAFAISIAAYLANLLLVSKPLVEARRLISDIGEGDSSSFLVQTKGDEIEKLMHEIRTVDESVKGSMGTLRRIESYRKDFLGDISHELKTPIFAVRGFAETLIQGAIDDPEVRISFLEKIVQNADRLGSLAEDLSAITRIETGELKMEMSSFDLEEVIVDVVSQLEPIAAAERVTLSYRVGPQIGKVFGDSVRIHQVVRNLAENALKYTPANGFTEIVVRKLGRTHVRVSVVDNGMGIPSEDIERITERFFRVDKSRSRGLGGTGLGLAIVKHILAAHKQKLRIESEVNVGSTFAFDLSLASPD